MSKNNITIKKNIPEGWKETTLGEVSKVQTGPFGSQLKNEQYIIGGTPVITVEHIKDFRIKKFDYPSVTDEDKKRLSKYLLKEGDIVFTRVGSVDLSAYVDKLQDEWMFSSRMLSVRTNDEVDSRFLSYFFRQNTFRKYIYRISVGATMPSINTSILKSIPISYPSLLTEQKAIADILLSFDDKIELLHEQNKTLEETAQTIFKEWFGKYSVDRPEEFPQGWRVENIGEKNFSEVIGSGIEKFDGEKIYLATADVSHNNITNIDTKITYENRASRANIQPVEKSIFFAKMQDSRKLLMFDDFSKNNIENMILSTGFAGIKTTEISHYYLWNFVLSSQFDNLINNLANGAVQVALNNTSLKKIEIIVPDDEVLKNFSKIVKPLFKKIFTNKSQIQSLEKTRDTLLPKLMKGDVRINSK